MRKNRCILCILLLLVLFIPPGCAAKRAQTRFSVTYGVFFDTVCSFYMGADSKEAFDGTQSEVLLLLQTLDGLFDIYEDYEENNLKTVNDFAGRESVKVDGRILSLMEFCLDGTEWTGGAFNPMMGAVTTLWKEATERQTPPEEEELNRAGLHTDPACLKIDRENSTLYIADSEARIDVGAAAKGYAARLVGELLHEKGIENWLLALGGNICTSGMDPRTGNPWTVGVANPFGAEGDDPFGGRESVENFGLSGLSAVTGGSYERFFDYEGRRYHHIIDPNTLYPAATEGTVSVSVFLPDPALGDVLSTALFILPKEEGKKLAEQLGTQVLWIDEKGDFFETESLDDLKVRTCGSGTRDFWVLGILAVLAFLAAILALWRRKTKKNPPETGGESFFEVKEKPFPEKTEGDDGQEEAAEKGFGDQRPPRLGRFGKRDFVLLGALAAVSLLILLVPAFLMNTQGKDGKYVVVRIDGEKVYEQKLKDDGEYEAKSTLGRNLVCVKNGKVWIAEADCPGKDCVRCGKLDENSLPSVIACLPHKLTVTIEERAD